MTCTESKTLICILLDLFFLDQKVNPADFVKEEWFFPESTINFSQLLLQYHGFCAYTFAVNDGLLIPGTITMDNSCFKYM